MSHVFRNGIVTQCERIFNFERNYKYHVKSCSGVNKYKCETCVKMSIIARKVYEDIEGKQHGNDVCCLTFFCGEFALGEFLTYIMKMCSENFS